ncbi:MAG: metal ABC transporter permease [Acetobacterium sp.]|nr:metal ABC transporter permease [Acetobacterium sp.]
MIELLTELLSYAFVVRALIVGVLVSLCAALLGVSLVLKRYSMIGDGLSHVGFGALALAMALNLSPLEVAIPVVAMAAFVLLRISENSRIKGDAAIALISSSALAIGVIIISYTSGMNADTSNYMFGSILAMSESDVLLSVAVSVVVILLYVLFYNKIFAVTFDESFTRATGTNAGRYNTLIALLTAMTIVVGMRMMGALLISSLIIFPALTSMRLFKTFKQVVISSAILSVCCFVVGIILSFIFSFPTGASVVVINLLMFVIFSAIGLVKKTIV